MTEASERHPYEWYWLATLYGDPEGSKNLRSKNRVAWNRCMAGRLSEKDKAELIAQGRHSADELNPFTSSEIEDIKKEYASRNGSGISFPDLNSIEISFSDVLFDERTDFEHFLFPVDVIFSGSKFPGHANFKGATFSGRANFERATFSGHADFERATFLRDAWFEGAKFSSYALFEEAKFSEFAAFVNARMEAVTTFARAEFKSPPDFAGATLHEGTIWLDVKWPLAPRDRSSAALFVRAYERLKFEMDRLKKHEDELEFFAREMQSRRVLQGRWKGLPIALYGLLSRYGRSYARPLYGILITALIGALPFWQYFGLSKFKKAFGYSLANTLGVFGLRKDFISPELVEALPSSLKIVAAMQTIIGGVLIFLFGLALRNVFRMK
jgi:hypothetical protein